MQATNGHHLILLYSVYRSADMRFDGSVGHPLTEQPRQPKRCTSEEQGAATEHPSAAGVAFGRGSFKEAERLRVEL